MDLLGTLVGGVLMIGGGVLFSIGSIRLTDAAYSTRDAAITGREDPDARPRLRSGLRRMVGGTMGILVGVIIFIII